MIDVAAALQQALSLAQSGRADAAVALLQRVVTAEPRQPDALRLLGLIARAQGDQAGAAAWLRQSLAARPAQPDVQNTLGNALLALGQSDAAVAAYEAAIRLQPSFPEALTNLGLAQLARNEPEAACDALARATAQDPRSAKAWAALGRAERAAGRLPNALAAFRTALALRPDHLPTLHNYAVALRLSGEATEAAALLERCVAASPGSAEIRYNLGHAYRDMGRLGDAADLYRVAVALQPGNREMQATLNRLLWETGSDGYLGSYSAALASDPNHAGLIADFAERLNLGGRIAEAIALVEAARARGVDDAELRAQLGESYTATGRDEEARTEFAAAVALAPEKTDTRLALARCLIRLERYDEAAAALTPVRALTPTEQGSLALETLIWQLSGDPRAKTRLDMERFVRSYPLTPPPAWGDVASFNQRLEAVLARHHTTSRHPLEQTLRGGTQTMGELFDLSDPEIAVLRGMIEGAVAAYIAAMPDDPDHVFTGRKRAGFRFAGSWSVRLRSAGFHLNHVHPEGWISSVYYVALPSVVNGEDQQGWLTFGESNLGLGARERVALTVRPEVGTLVLFPSYFYHGTRPFKDARARTTVAFDVVPA